MFCICFNCLNGRGMYLIIFNAVEQNYPIDTSRIKFDDVMQYFILLFLAKYC